VRSAFLWRPQNREQLAGKDDCLSSSRRENGGATLLVRISYSPFRKRSFSPENVTSRQFRRRREKTRSV